ncbi:MAG: CRISPR-associated endonuclease Cas2 [Tenericutes bacterium]|nr:CRISPR-associated endonuclease Cas2 [Mycoplasmatota bacterium]
MLVWVIYDIGDDNVRNAVANRCKGYGLYRVQKSAFLGTLNSNQQDSLVIECRDLIEESDSVYIFPMCNNCLKRIELLGKDFDLDLVRDKLGIMFV